MNEYIILLLNKIGITSSWWISFITGVLNVAMLAIIAWLVYLATTKWVSRIILRVVDRTKTRWDNVFFSQTLFRRVGLLLAAIVIAIILKSASWEVPPIISNLIGVAVTICGVLAITETLYGVNRIYETFSRSKDHPIKIIIQVISIFLWCAAVMITISIFTDVKLAVLLGSLTAFAAVIMLIFQDSILGFVAGIQFSANNMLRLGDWIEMPSRGVDGDVIEINLTTVKVQNWDKTITTIPTHKLVSESFTNWRGMEESKGRRIKRSVNIDVNTIHYLTEEEIETMRRSSLLNSYIDGKLAELEEFNRNRSTLLDERRLTNVGTFREYLESWLATNPDINLEMTHMVRQLQPGPTGLPLEVYCFSARQVWVQYERVQADIFDHIYAVMPLFGLKAYEYSGAVVAAQ